MRIVIAAAVLLAVATVAISAPTSKPARRHTHYDDGFQRRQAATGAGVGRSCWQCMDGCGRDQALFCAPERPAGQRP